MKTLRIVLDRLPGIRAFSQVAFEEGKQILNASTQNIDKLSQQKPHGLNIALHKTLKIPLLNEMKNAQWIQAGGPKLTRELAKLYQVIPDILPYETEATVNVKSFFGNVPVKRGDLLAPDKLEGLPNVSFETAEENMFYSVYLLDGDYPNLTSSKLDTFLLWARGNIQSQAFGEEVVITANNESGAGEELCSFIPPHPFRGSGAHRCAFILVKHSDKIALDLQPNRLINFLELLENHKAVICGYTFFRTCWTKTASELYRRHFGANVEEPSFGELAEPVSVKEYKYANA